MKQLPNKSLVVEQRNFAREAYLLICINSDTLKNNKWNTPPRGGGGGGGGAKDIWQK
jgi:hypothetical protein